MEVDTSPAAYNTTQTKVTMDPIKEHNAALLGVPSAKRAHPNKQKDASRPVSTSSGTSVSSTAESQTGLAANSANQLGESQDSLSTMPTPRNTFLYPPTGINIPDKPQPSTAAQGTANNKVINWVSEHHQQQLQELLEKKGIPGDKFASPRSSRLPCAQASYDDSYFLLSQPADRTASPASREAAISMLRKIANTNKTLDKTAGREHQQPAARLIDMPLPLVPPVDTLSRLEDALMGILARRNVPNRTRAYNSQRGGAGSIKLGASATGFGSTASLAASAKASRRKQRMSMMSSGQESNSSAAGNADDMRSMRSRVSAISGEAMAASATPYTDLNDHIDRLTACMSRLQATPLDSSAAAGTDSQTSSQPLHIRQNSTSGLGGKPLASAQSLAAAPLTNETFPIPPSHTDLQALRENAGSRLSPVSEGPADAERASVDEQQRPPSSSRASVMSGTSTESKRRIMVTEVLTSSHFPNLFGNSIIDVSQTNKPQIHASPSAATISTHSESIHSQASAGSSTTSRREHRRQRSPTLQQPPPPPLSSGAMHRESFFGHGLHKAPSVISRSAGNSASPSPSSPTTPAVSVREITPAGRLALWMNVHSNIEISKTSLWRRKQWHRRFAIFAGNVLYLFKNSSPTATANTVIRLSTNTIVCVNDAFNGRSWVVEVTLPPQSSDIVAAQSWYLQTEMRAEMITLLKQLKVAIGELQVQPDVERKEEERMRNRRKKQRKEARGKTDVCPWEVDEFSEGSTGPTESEEDGDDDTDSHDMDIGGGLHRIPDDELFPSDDDEPLAVHSAAANLESYSMSNAMAVAAASAASAGDARPAVHSAQDYTGTGGIAEWGAHRLHMPYNPALASGLEPGKTRSFSADPSVDIRRRPSLADAVAPPKSASHETASSDHAGSSSPKVSPRAMPRSIRARGVAGLANPSTRNSMMLRSDASMLIDQMFASASKELSSPLGKSSGGGSSSRSPGHSSGKGAGSGAGGNLAVVREED
ncbi:hypothetical protein IW140_000310 [Coemansia sp. RSA 1813]|nr:hypothetical protein EV178_000510 [Coemansia sp. RSA 1646]KAJ1773722.1 hypothetical protein LPJ74_000265 [Coemansia sp. RSA 1843]KAJ2093683.1 hypothetical protein IW138_000078 [Coemansia sp. RSA 986]KAJ2217896.1 hypothetical protein EV179_000040 [Coemansia sp. RSA 487]KAJ2573266.1 hypothetical protein IW140_000310 [Coemansia sp. RSA 1813]